MHRMVQDLPVFQVNPHQPTQLTNQKKRSLAECDESLKSPTAVYRLTMNQSLICKQEYNSLLDLTNAYGMIRLNKVRDSCFANAPLDFPEIVNIYRKWRDTSEHIILAFRSEFEMDLYGYNTWSEQNYLCIKAAKKGNDVYKYLLKQKWKQVDMLPDIEFFREGHSTKKTSMLSITLTYNTNRCPIEAAWLTHSEEFHLFLAKLRQKYGDFEFIRVWEAHDNYYPHCHVVIAFKEHSFPVWVQRNKDGSIRYRVSDEASKTIGSFWHSFSDISAVSNTQKALTHLSKYLTKDLMSEKGDKTNAMTWFFRRQSYAISRGFFGLIHRSFAKIDLSEPETGDLIKPLMANRNYFFELMGIFPTSALKFDDTEWYHVMKKPPPDVILLVHAEYLRRLEFSR